MQPVKIALDHLDEIISLIRCSQSGHRPQSTGGTLRADRVQAQAPRYATARLTGLERQKSLTNLKFTGCHCPL
jgi:DNA gyrase/topoisomerase IV subunit A